MNIGSTKGKQNFKPNPYLFYFNLNLLAVLLKAKGVACNLQIQQVNLPAASNLEQLQKLSYAIWQSSTRNRMPHAIYTTFSKKSTVLFFSVHLGTETPCLDTKVN